MDWMKDAQHVLDFVRSILTFVSRNWDIIGIGVGILAARGWISQKNSEIIGRVFDRNLSVKSQEINNAVASVGNGSDTASMNTAIDKAEILLAEVVGSVAKESPLNPSDIKSKARDLAKEIVLTKAGIKPGASADIANGVRVTYDGDKFSVNASGMANKGAYKIKKFLKKVF